MLQGHCIAIIVNEAQNQQRLKGFQQPGPDLSDQIGCCIADGISVRSTALEDCDVDFLRGIVKSCISHNTSWTYLCNRTAVLHKMHLLQLPLGW